MKLIIDISENVYEHISSRYKYQDKNDIGLSDLDIVGIAIKDGTPLQKGHGDLMLLSKDKVKENQINLDFSCQKWISEVGLSNATVTIIEAESE